MADVRGRSWGYITTREQGSRNGTGRRKRRHLSTEDAETNRRRGRGRLDRPGTLKPTSPRLGAAGVCP
jgi:hypothetical protein